MVHSSKECFNPTFEYLTKPDIRKVYPVSCQQKQPPQYALYSYLWAFVAWAYEAMSFVGKTVALSKQCPLLIPRILDGEGRRSPNMLILSEIPFPDQVDDASCKTFSGEVVDSAVDSEDRSPDERITDVLSHIHGEDDIEEFGDAAQNGYETANEEVV
ncbi:hypothetical protein K7X08_010542 [Anisodus acutangulus]|uniref:Uncharacterized protein n=1 Tax=Anisodus acutangulus TaxID=402998 RepID=A0A9Q1N2Y5_9SOLA|nr:hypothetical protein K7X08_010542 [Anisodus acutangulus]